MSLHKLLSYSLILFISTITLEARDNPFVPTKSYMEKKAEMVDESYVYEVKSMDDSHHMSNNMMKDKKDHMMMGKGHMDSIMLTNGKHNLLPFIMLDISDDTLSINTNSQLLKKFDLNYKGTRKIVFDFRSSKGFYTKRAELSSFNYKNIAIGAHPMDGYFRIAISVDDIPSNYDVMYEGDTILISKEQM